jgi:hypothetical protein
MLMTMAGCVDNNIALIGRKTLTARDVPDELVATLERLDTSSRQLHLLGSDGRGYAVRYGPETSVIYRGRDYPVTQLVPGDVLAMQLKRDSTGQAYTDLIRVQRAGAANQDSGALAIQSIDGTVADVDLQQSSFDLHGSSGERMLVTVAEDLPRYERERFRKLNAGDYVRIEARSLGPRRFELEAFLAGK